MADATVIKTPAQRAEELLAKLWNRRDATGAEIRKEAKALFPDIAIPEDVTDLAIAPIKAEMDGMRAELKTALDKLSDRAKADDESRQMIDLDAKIRAAAKEYNLTDAGREKMLERMKALNSLDAQATAAWVVAQQPKVSPNDNPGWLPQAANMWGSQEKDDAFEALHANPQKYQDDQLREFARDPDKYVRETFGTI